MYKETAHDYDVKYRGSYLVWNSPDGRVPIFVKDFNQDGSKITARSIAYYRKAREKKEISIPISDIEFNTLPRGCINLTLSVFVINEESPFSGEARYRKGLTKENSSFFDPFAAERILLHSMPFVFDNVVVLNQVIDNRYFPAQECLENVQSLKRLGQAFHPDYFFGLKYRPNSVMLFRRDYMIAKVNNKGVIKLPKASHPLYEELSEFGLTVERV